MFDQSAVAVRSMRFRGHPKISHHFRDVSYFFESKSKSYRLCHLAANTKLVKFNIHMATIHAANAVRPGQMLFAPGKPNACRAAIDVAGRSSRQANELAPQVPALSVGCIEFPLRAPPWSRRPERRCRSLGRCADFTPWLRSRGDDVGRFGFRRERSRSWNDRHHPIASVMMQKPRVRLGARETVQVGSLVRRPPARTGRGRVGRGTAGSLASLKRQASSFDARSRSRTTAISPTAPRTGCVPPHISLPTRSALAPDQPATAGAVRSMQDRAIGKAHIAFAKLCISSNPQVE